MLRSFRQIVALWVVLASAPVLADGMVWITKSAVEAGAEPADVIPEAQRALYQYVPTQTGAMEGVWELTIQPKYQRPDSEAVWTIPFPVCPEVSQGDGAMLNDLDRLTSTLFVDGCVQDCECEASGGFCFGSTDSTGGQEQLGRGFLPGKPVGVRVWQEGELGAMDFVVLSAPDGDDLLEWMEENGYAVDPALEAYVSNESNAGECYFAARLNKRLDEDEVLPAVKFRLPGMEDPVYPLRLTKLGMPEDGTRLELKLWVAIPFEVLQNLPLRSVEPSNREWSVPSCLELETPTVEEFETCMTHWLEGDGSGELSLTYATNFSERVKTVVQDGQICHAALEPFARYGASCVDVEGIFDDLPELWSLGLQHLGTTHHFVYRYEAQLEGDDMNEDIVLNAGATSGSWYTPCTHDNACKGYFSGYLRGGVQGTSFHGLCEEMEGEKRCTTYCTGDQNCPSGWTCKFIENVYADPNASVRACFPETPEALPNFTDTVEPAPYVNVLFANIKFDCGYDCKDVCEGNVTGGTYPVYQSIAGEAPLSKVLLPLMLLLAAFVGALALLRRRQRVPA